MAKKDDASALKNLLEQDKIEEVYVLRQLGTESEYELFLMALMTQAAIPLQVIDDLPKKLTRHQALLLLGSNAWINQQAKLPSKQIYTVLL